MKKVFSFIAILAIIFLSNCSRIEDNNDPILGVWHYTDVSSNTSKNVTLRQEWIFNDAYLGRFHTIQNGAIVERFDFKWKNENEVYTINYPEKVNRTTDKVILKDSALVRVHNNDNMAIRD